MGKKQRKIRAFEGLPVVDATHNIMVHVTAQDVKNSDKKNPGNCAAAVAGRREMKKEVRVFLSRMYVKEGKKWVRYVTPNNAAREIISFDRGSSFEPGEYLFKKATPSQQLGSGKNYPTGPHKTTKNKQHITQNVRISAREGYRVK